MNMHAQHKVGHSANVQQMSLNFCPDNSMYSVFGSVSFAYLNEFLMLMTMIKAFPFFNLNISSVAHAHLHVTCTCVCYQGKDNIK